MVRRARVVEHLRLRGESESAVRHALPALEDAFRTASLPDAGARLICVRRLQLGQLAANASAQSVSLLIEKRFAEDDWTIVHAVEDGADGAQAVWFRDVFEAHEAAALRIAAGQPLDDWFWPLALPAITAAASEERLRAIALAVAATEEAPAALPAWTASLVRAGYRAQLIAALRPGDGRALLRCGRRQRRLDTCAHEHAMSPDDAPRRHVRAGNDSRTAEPRRVSDRGQRNAELDDRVVFVEVMTSRASGRPRTMANGDRGAIEGEPPGHAPAAVGRKHRTVGARPRPRRTRAPSPEARLESGVDRRNNPAITQQRRPDCRVHGQPTHRGGAWRRPRPSATAGGAFTTDGELVLDARTTCRSARSRRADWRRANDRTIDEPHAFRSPWQLPDTAPTAAGGLLFLLPVLERVGFAKWAAERGTGGARARRFGRADPPSAALAAGRRRG